MHVLEAIEIIAEDVCAHVGALCADPLDEDDAGELDSDWAANNGLLEDLLDLAEVANRAAAIVDRPRVRQYLAEASFPRSPRLAEILAMPVHVATVRPAVPAPAPAEPEPAPPPVVRPTGLPDVLLVEMGLTRTKLHLALAAYVLAGNEHVDSSTMAALIGTSPGGSVLRALKRLERRGWLRQTYAGGGRTASIFQATDQLRAVVVKVKGGAE